jgi:tetratricopeptide (TPR) repeat protein
MRIVNIRFLGLMLLAIALISVAAYAFHEFQARRQADALLREARLAKDKGELDLAIDYLDRYVALVPRQSLEALAELGLLQAQTGRIGEAYGTLEAVLRKDTSRGDIRRKLVEVALSLRRFPDAQFHVDLLCSAGPVDAELLALRAQCQIGLEDYPAAVASLREALALAPDRLDDSARLAALLESRMKQPSEAMDVLDEMLSRNPEAARAYVIRGSYRLLRRQAPTRRAPAEAASDDDVSTTASADSGAAEYDPTQRVAPLVVREDEGSETVDPAAGAAALPTELGALEAALEDARRALELAPEDSDVIAFAVNCLLANGRGDEAGELALRGVALNPKNAPLYVLLAEFELQKGHRDDAATWLKRGFEAAPREGDLLFNLTQLFLDAGQSTDAAKALEALQQIAYPKPRVGYLEARLEIKKGEWFEAANRLEEIRPELVAWPELSKRADLFLGQCYAELGRFDLQSTAFRRASRVDPLWIPARLGVANALLAAGQVKSALAEYQAIVALPQAPASVAIQLARLLILSNLARNPSQQDWDRPKELLDRLDTIVPDSDEVAILRAEILVARGDIPAAERLLSEARDRAPEKQSLRLALASLAERSGDAARAAEILDEIEQSTGDSVELRLARARQLVGQQGAEAREKLHQLAESVDAFNAGDRSRLYSGLAEWTLAIGDFDESKRLVRLVVRQQPANLGAQLLLFDLGLRSEDSSVLKEALADVRRIEHEGPLWHYGEAVRLAVAAKSSNDRSLYDRAVEHLTSAKVKRPNWSRVFFLLGQIAEAEGKEEIALSYHLEAIKFGERNPGVAARAVALLYQRHRFPEADRVIRLLQEQQVPFSNEMMRLATEISLKLSDNVQALALATSAAASSKDPAEHIWAGRVLSTLGQADAAEKSFRQAIELDESAPAAWVALIQHFGRSGQMPKADATLAEARERIDSAGEPLAEALESIGRIEEAESSYKAALLASPDELLLVRRLAEFYVRQRKFNEAEPLLTRLLEDRERVTGEDRMQCRRNLALALLARNDKSSRKQAQSLIDENLAANPKSDADQRTKAMLLALSPERASRFQAVERLEKYLGEEQSGAAAEGSAEARFVLATLYVDLGEPAKAAGHLRTLMMATRGEEFRYLAYYVRFLIQRNEIREAEVWQSQLEKLFPQEIATLALAADLAFARERYGEILSRVDPFLANAQWTEAEKLERTRLVASLLEANADRLKKVAADKPERAAAAEEWAPQYLKRAEALFRGDSGELPKNALAEAAFYGRTGRYSEALDLLEKNWSGARPEELFAVTTTLARSATATKEDFARAAQVLNKALEKQDRPAGLVLALANLQNWGEEFAEAEKLYREVLEKEPGNAGTLNNLAILLALRGSGGREPLRLIEKAIELAGSNPGLLDSRATIYLALGDARRAADDLAQALKGRPSPGSYFRQALAEARLGQRDAAQESLAKASQLGLRIEELHPLERPIFRQLQSELGRQ